MKDKKCSAVDGEINNGTKDEKMTFSTVIIAWSILKSKFWWLGVAEVLVFGAMGFGIAYGAAVLADLVK